MRCAVLVAVCVTLAWPAAASAERLPVEGHAAVQLEGGVSPGGKAALRYLHSIGDRGTRIGPGIGLGTTGTLLSVLVEQPFYRTVAKSTAFELELDVQFNVYGAYALGLFSGGARGHAFAGDPELIATGEYHWLDIGLSYQLGGAGFFVGAGLGVSLVLHSPAQPEGAVFGDESYLWWTTSEGWVRNKGGPAMWLSAGYAFD